MAVETVVVNQDKSFGIMLCFYVWPLAYTFLHIFSEIITGRNKINSYLFMEISRRG